MPLPLTPLDASVLSPVVAKVVGPGGGPAKIMAARGLVPMGPKDLVTALYQLSLDADTKIAEMAKGTAEGLPDNILGAALGDALQPLVLHFFAAHILDRPALIEKLLLNRATHDQTLIYLATKLGERELELLASNQERLLRCPAIIEALYFNRQARMSTVERLLEMAARNGLNLNQIPQFKEIAAGILGGKIQKRSEEEAAAMDAAFAEVLAEDDGEIGEMEMDAAEGEGEGIEEDVPGGKKRKKISEMTIMEKVRLASVGSSADRAVLIRDANRTVSMAAIESPAISDQEVARFASNRSLGEEVIRVIANKKEWHKNYQVKVSLVNNPKCPVSHSMHFLPHLRPNDLRALVRSKNIPSALVNAAKEMLRKKSG